MESIFFLDTAYYFLGGGGRRANGLAECIYTIKPPTPITLFSNHLLTQPING